jgi:hypothetical protein
MAISPRSISVNPWGVRIFQDDGIALAHLGGQQGDRLQVMGAESDGDPGSVLLMGTEGHGNLRHRP